MIWPGDNRNSMILLVIIMDEIENDEQVLENVIFNDDAACHNSSHS